MTVADKPQPTGRQRRQWADHYGSRWYLHFDGKPPHDDENSYVWTGTHWALFDEEDDE